MNRLAPESRRRVKRVSAAAALAATATAAVVLGPPPSVAADLLHNAFGRDNAVELAIERVASETYGTKIYAHCAPTSAYGQASPRYHTIRLNLSVCNTLAGIIANPEAVDDTDPDNAIAILGVAHELSHIHGAGLQEEGNEGVTQCLGAQRSEQVALAFGIPADKAKVVGDYAAIAANAPPAPEYAIPAGCVDGGPHDINAPGNHFPYDPTQAFINGD